MKISLSLIVVLILLNTLVPTSHCNDLVDQTCRKTPLPVLCRSILNADPRTEEAGVDGLAIIMIGEVEPKASDVIAKINQLRMQKSPQDKPLSDCLNYYVAVVQDNVPQASDAADGGDGGTAERLMNDVFGKADSCEYGFKKFKGGSPLTRLNAVVKDVSSVAAAISKLI